MEGNEIYKELPKELQKASQLEEMMEGLELQNSPDKQLLSEASQTIASSLVVLVSCLI